MIGKQAVLQESLSTASISTATGRTCPIPLKNGSAIGYNCLVFANLDGWGAVDDGGAESPTRRVVL